MLFKGAGLDCWDHEDTGDSATGTITGFTRIRDTFGGGCPPVEDVNPTYFKSYFTAPSNLGSGDSMDIRIEGSFDRIECNIPFYPAGTYDCEGFTVTTVNTDAKNGSFVVNFGNTDFTTADRWEMDAVGQNVTLTGMCVGTCGE